MKILDVQKKLSRASISILMHKNNASLFNDQNGKCRLQFQFIYFYGSWHDFKLTSDGLANELYRLNAEGHQYAKTRLAKSHRLAACGRWAKSIVYARTFPFGTTDFKPKIKKKYLTARFRTLKKLIGDQSKFFFLHVKISTNLRLATCKLFRYERGRMYQLIL